MSDKNSRKLIEQLINKNKWTGILRRFSDVLKINIFIVDSLGCVIVPPYLNGQRGRYGSKFLSDSFGFDFAGKGAGILDNFEAHGAYFEAKDPFDFHVFAVPIKLAEKEEEDNIIAYMIVGPVILNKGWDKEDYLNMANQINLDANQLIDAIHEIRVVSFVAIKAILDLLAEIVKDIVELNAEKRSLYKKDIKREMLPKEVAKTAQDIYKTIHLNELLISILDVCLNLTQAECGSIMLIDKEKKRLMIKVSKGIDESIVKKVRLEIGQGIAGIAAKENKSFVISGSKADNRIKNLLKRPEIKQSAVIPLANKDEVLGVLNLHTKKDKGAITTNIENVKHLSKLISTAISTI